RAAPGGPGPAAPAAPTSRDRGESARGLLTQPFSSVSSHRQGPIGWSPARPISAPIQGAPDASGGAAPGFASLGRCEVGIAAGPYNGDTPRLRREPVGDAITRSADERGRDTGQAGH